MLHLIKIKTVLNSKNALEYAKTTYNLEMRHKIENFK